MRYILLFFLIKTNCFASAPCEKSQSLLEGIECIKQNESSYTESANGTKEADSLEKSAYRLINPELELEVMDGKSLGDVKRDMTAALLFTFELGGKRKARAQSLGSEGLLVRADAFEQQILALTELGGALLRLHQLAREREVLEESISTFKKVIRLYQSRGQLPPEHKVSLHTFELVVLDFSRKLLEVGAEHLKFRRRAELLFGPNAAGQPFLAEKFKLDVKTIQLKIEEWLVNTPEMLRIRGEQMKADGELALARADAWPDLRVGPMVAQTTDGPVGYSSLGLKLSFQLPVLSMNGSLRESREMTQKRVQSKARWNEQDVRAKYESLLSEVDKIQELLKEAPTETDIHKKHATTESLFEKGLISGALMIESHRTLVEHYETRHTLERELLEAAIKLQHLTGKNGTTL